MLKCHFFLAFLDSSVGSKNKAVPLVSFSLFLMQGMVSSSYFTVAFVMLGFSSLSSLLSFSQWPSQNCTWYGSPQADLLVATQPKTGPLKSWPLSPWPPQPHPKGQQGQLTLLEICIGKQIPHAGHNHIKFSSPAVCCCSVLGVQPMRHPKKRLGNRTLNGSQGTAGIFHRANAGPWPWQSP